MTVSVNTCECIVSLCHYCSQNLKHFNTADSNKKLLTIPVFIDHLSGKTYFPDAGALHPCHDIQLRDSH